jgi:hypothetical protein
MRYSYIYEKQLHLRSNGLATPTRYSFNMRYIYTNEVQLHKRVLLHLLYTRYIYTNEVRDTCTFWELANSSSDGTRKRRQHLVDVPVRYS